MIPKNAVRLVAVVAGATLAAACQDAAPPVAPSPDLAPSLQVAGSPQDRLAAWFRRASPEVLALPGTVFADNDEAVGRLVFGVENAAVIASVGAALTRLGIPSSAYDIRVTEPIVFANTLRDVFRPTQGGIQIHFSRFLCTLGFNVDHESGQRSFITNSHCTDRQGVIEGTQYFQPTSTADPTVIATEVDDPAYFNFRTDPTNTSCPRGRRCRYSDASRALYSSVGSTRGEIAQTTGPNNNSVEVSTTNQSFSITSQDDITTSFPTNGTFVVNKVGRTTGWTQGPVTRTCVDTGVLGSNIVLLCQTFVSLENVRLVGAGDSGSPVFQITSGDNVQLVGILWGGSSSGSTFVFSPLKQIQDELGALTATK
jgi:hypothetical protein